MSHNKPDVYNKNYPLELKTDEKQYFSITEIALCVFEKA